MKIILSCGDTALVDDEDADCIRHFNWYLSVCGRITKKHYAIGSLKNKTIYMHRLILNPPKGLLVDHINGNGLDNRRSNLRLATSSQNAINSISLRPHGYRGVTLDAGRYRARVEVNGKNFSAGTFSTPLEAAQAYDSVAVLHHGEFAVLNFAPSFEAA